MRGFDGRGYLEVLPDGRDVVLLALPRRIMGLVVAGPRGRNPKERSIAFDGALACIIPLCTQHYCERRKVSVASAAAKMRCLVAFRQYRDRDII